MAEILCGYTADRDETLTAYLYDDIEPAQRAAFEVHIGTCERCRLELADLKRVRARLAEWTTPGLQRPGARIAPVETMESVDAGDPGNVVDIAARGQSDSQQSHRGTAIWAVLRDIPVWLQLAAACVFLGVSAGIANLEVRYDGNCLTIHTGWSRSSVSVMTALAPS